MPRKKIIRTDLFPYHITTRTNNQDWFKVPIGKVWSISQNILLDLHEKYSVKIHAFVLMNNHYHMIISTPEKNIDIFMGNFNKRLSDEINRVSSVINHKFGGRYKWSIVDSKGYAYNVFKYVYRNPLKAGICERCENYSFSTLRTKPSYLTSFLPDDPYELIRFYNQKISSEEDESIKCGLSKSYFIPRQNRSTRKPYKLETY